MWDYIASQVPWWVYLAVGLLGTGALFYFFSPVLIPLWNLTPRWVKVLLGSIGAALLAWQAGRNKGVKDAKAQQAENDRQATEHRSEIDTSVRNATDADLDKRHDRWLRD